ncbi:MAG TPA: beta-ketoacyl-[acyl-carrier-protein] synthase family protein [Thermoanaerobaculia bacterium]|nr:beta-ketoacyl-[acyl-carrier-protein] synthase family protein [Thermoanaerobaculia bacterium]
MSSLRRVAVTGIGVVSALGRGREATLRAAHAGASGIRTISRVNAAEFLCRVAGEVPAGAIDDAPADRDRFTRFALVAAEEAVAQARLENAIPSERIGTLIGTGLGGSETLDGGYERLYRNGNQRFHPMSIPKAMYNAAASAVAARFNALGPSLCTVSACASATHAIGQAALWIQHGLADAVIAGGADAPIVPGIVRAWEALRVLARGGDAPEAACRPFSADRTGLVLAEGAGIFVLEALDLAIARRQPIVGEILGCGFSSDGGHVTDPSPAGAARAMRTALDQAGLTPADVEYINAHGTGTTANDLSETAAIKELFGDHAYRIPVSSTKAMHGHAMGASGAIELAITLLALNDGILPPTINFSGGDPDCDLDYVPNQARGTSAHLFLSNSFGFGGMNAVLAARAGLEAGG